MGYKYRGIVFYSNNLRSNSTKHITSATTASEGKCVLGCVFIRHLRWPLSEIIHLFHDFPCAHERSCEFLGILYASKLSSVRRYVSITWNTERLVWPWIGFCCRFTNPLSYQCYSLESTLVGHQIWPQIGTWRPYYLFFSLSIRTWMTYYLYHKSPIWHFNTIFYWELAQLLLGILLLRNW